MSNKGKGKRQKMSNDAAKRIQSNADRKGNTDGFKERAQRAAANNNNNKNNKGKGSK